MAQHTHDVYDTGKHFEINGISRFIKETSDTKLVLVQGDHNSEVITFQMPRYIDGHDMLLCNKIRVHYINLDTKTSNKSADVYEVTDLTLCEECEDVLTFTWTIEEPATKYSGSLAFLIKFECTEGDSILYQWNTAKYVSVNVLAGIDNSEEFVEKYSNVLEEWYNELTNGADSIEELNQQALAEIEHAKEDAKEDIENKVKSTMAEMDKFSTDTYNSFKNDVDEKAVRTLASIPEDYTAMDAEVKDIKETLVDLGVNKLDVTDQATLKGFLITNGDFIEQEHSPSRVTDFIEVIGYEKIEYTLTGRITTQTIAFYDESKAFISNSGVIVEDGVNESSEVEIPINATYMRATEWEKDLHDHKILLVSNITKLKELENRLGSVEQNKADLTDVPSSVCSKDGKVEFYNANNEKLFDCTIDSSELIIKKLDVTNFPNKGWISDEGNPIPHPSVDNIKYTDYISVDGYDKVKYSLYSRITTSLISFYDENKVVISNMAYDEDAERIGTIDIPSDAKYMCATQYVIEDLEYSIKLVKEYHVFEIGDKTESLYEQNRKDRFFTELLEIVDSPMQKRIYFIGDSITQGATTDGFIMFDDSVTGKSIRGNGANYPLADSDYQVGDFIFEDASRIWYEALDGNGFVQKIKAYWESKFNCIVKNYGMSGATLQNVMSALPTYIDNIDIAFIMIGANDSGVYDLTTYADNLRSVIKTLLDNDKTIFLMSTPPSSNEHGSGRIFHMEDASHICAKISNEFNIPFIQNYDKWIEYCRYTNTTIESLLNDTVHPNDKGHLLIMDSISEYTGLSVKKENATW